MTEAIQGQFVHVISRIRDLVRPSLSPATTESLLPVNAELPAACALPSRRALPPRRHPLARS